MISQNPNDLAQVGFAETLVPAQLDGRQPELRFISSLMDMHVCWRIWFGAVKTGGVALFAQDLRHAPHAMPAEQETQASRAGQRALAVASLRFCNVTERLLQRAPR